VPSGSKQKSTTQKNEDSELADIAGDVDTGITDQNPPVHSQEIRGLVDQEGKEDKNRRPVHVRVAVRQGESVEQMLRRFNYVVHKTNIIQRLRDLQFYEKPSKRRQREMKLRTQQIRRYDK